MITFVITSSFSPLNPNTESLTPKPLTPKPLTPSPTGEEGEIHDG
ncbi:hypothetical protein [Kamptonema formosum]|nr:hypothetical protein [Oscillatoria sp. PCC 10802]